MALEQNAVRNGDVKRESPPPQPLQQNEQQNQQQPQEIRQESPPLKRSDSAKSKSNSSSSSSSRSSSAKSKKSRPETAPGGNTPVQVEPVKADVHSTEAPESNNNKDSEEPAAVEEVAQVEETPDETTTQGAGVPTTEDQEPEKPNFNEDVLKEFVEVENQVKTLEEKGAVNGYQTKHTRLVEMHKKLVECQDQVQKLKAQTAKEYQDVVDINAAYSIRSFFVGQAQLNAEVEKEKKEYVDALNKQEIAEQELESMKQQYKKLYEEVIIAKKDQDELNSLKLKEEELLGRIFNDSYGSDKEWKLEMELDLLGQRKDRINAAYVRWRGARVYLDYAIKQLSWSARRWAQISTHRVTVLVVKVQMVSETRNHLIAAVQNISSAHGNLKPVNIPYCTMEDLEVLKSAINSIFNDFNTSDRYQKSYNLFVAMFSKSSHLHQWVGRVLEETITKDLAKAKQEFYDKYHELKEERMNLIKSKVKEKLGVELELDVKRDELVADDDSSAEEADIAKPGEVAKEEGDEQAPEPEDKEGVPTEALPSGEGEAPPEGEQPPDEAEAGADNAAGPKPAALSELAPPPSQEDLFGNIDQLKKQHEEEMAEFEKAQELNRARVDQGLQEKLRARRSRRRKIQAQEAEATALSGGESNNEPPAPSDIGL